MDPASIVAYSQPVADAGFIEWDGGKLRLLDRFYGVKPLDQGLRGALASFAPSTLGYDSISSWQFFQFLIDMGPIYATWFLESSRPANARSPAYYPSLFILLGQFVGVGTVVPLFYFSCIVFGPSAVDLAKAQRRHGRCMDDGRTVAPVILLFHTSVVYAMFTAQDPADRHYWTWFWQLSPLWIGLGTAAARRILAHLQSEHRAPYVMDRRKWPGVFGWLGLLCGISFGVWFTTVFAAPHPLATLFLPSPERQTGLVLHMRKALQADEMITVLSNGLWFAYTFAELHVVGLLGTKAVLYMALYPLATIIAGPGVAFVLVWQFKEDVLDNMRTS
ncbi:hypothetical protein PG985_015067 [Apiospora marii]|uniref:Uncharacterized protein n=1 Tax=Apiospora marii TaxID=335849 RepID=A0ABR1RM20_9PEZI